jgi:hypothetical protein
MPPQSPYDDIGVAIRIAVDRRVGVDRGQAEQARERQRALQWVDQRAS